MSRRLKLCAVNLAGTSQCLRVSSEGRVSSVSLVSVQGSPCLCFVIRKAELKHACQYLSSCRALLPLTACSPKEEKCEGICKEIIPVNYNLARDIDTQDVLLCAQGGNKGGVCVFVCVCVRACECTHV